MDQGHTITDQVRDACFIVFVLSVLMVASRSSQDQGSNHLLNKTDLISNGMALIQITSSHHTFCYHQDTIMLYIINKQCHLFYYFIIQNTFENMTDCFYLHCAITKFTVIIISMISEAE